MIELNKILADLTFLSSTIVKLELETHRPNISDSARKEFSMSIRHSQIQTLENHKIAQLQLHIHITIKTDDSNPDDSLFIILEGSFMTSNEMDNENFLAMLNINGGAAMYSIARSKIETISSAAYMEGKILLPMVNIIQFFKESSEQEKAKKKS